MHSFTIPGYVPPSVNTMLRLHWAARGRLKKKIYHTVSLAALLAGVPRARGKRRVRIEVTIAGRHRVPDQDNIQKGLLDALTNCNLLIDDGPAWVEVAPVIIKKGTIPGTTIHLEDLTDEER